MLFPLLDAKPAVEVKAETERRREQEARSDDPMQRWRLFENALVPGLRCLGVAAGPGDFARILRS